MIRFLLAEVLKLRRSLALLLCIAAPLCVTVLCILMSLRSKGPVHLDRYAMSGAAFWAFAMLPLSVTALSVLMAQTEHGPRTWDHVLAIPGARGRIFLAKALVMWGLVAVMTAIVGLSLVPGAQVLAAAKPVVGQLDMPALAATLAKMFAASALMCAIQLWTALAFRSFVPPLVLGILGTFVSVAATGAREGIYFPWLMPVHILSPEPAMQSMALEIGVVGGVAVLALMLVHLYRREAV